MPPSPDIEKVAHALYERGIVEQEIAYAVATAAIEALDPSGEVERPFGDAGDAIDFALDHMPDSFEMLCFLEDWRSDRAGEWPGYMKWLQTQRDGALEARAALSGEP